MNVRAEISVFGAGFGESIVSRISDHRWIIIDSLLDETGQPVALQYLKSIGVDVATDVAAVILTHWHDDHIAGAASIVRECRSAVIGIPITLREERFHEFLAAHGRLQKTSFGSGVSELIDIIKMVKSDKRHLAWCACNRIILEDRNAPIRVEALSPSDDDISVFLQNISSYYTGGSRVQRPNENFSSVVAVVEAWNDTWLFGADMERQKHGGWQRVIDRAWKGRDKATFIKIAHHGSKNGDHNQVWTDLLQTEPVAVLTSWNRGSKLPNESDVTRILSKTPNAYAASKPIQFRTKKRINTIERELDSMGIKIWRSLSEIGQVCAKKDDSGQWDVELIGPGAVHLSKILD